MADPTGSRRNLITILTEPHPKVSDPRRQRVARGMAGLALGLLMLNTVAAAAYYCLTRSIVLVGMVTEGIFLTVYLLCRTRWPKLGVAALAISSSAAIFVTLPSGVDPVLSLGWLVFPILLGTILLDVWAATAFSILNLAGAIAFAVASDRVPLSEATTPLLIGAFMGLIALGTRVIRDGDMRRLEEQARELAESRQRYWDLFTGIPVGLFEMTPDGRFSDVNPTCVELLGYRSREDLIAADPTDLWVDADRCREWRKQLANAGFVYHFESRFQRPDGSVIWARQTARAVRDEQGQVAGYRGSIEDVTAVKQAQQELDVLASVIEQSTEAVLLTDLDGHITYVNPAFERTSGYSAAEVRGENPSILKSGRHGDAFYRYLWHTITLGGVWSGMLVNKRKDGSLYQEEATIFPIRDAQGTTLHYAAVKRDVTERVHTLERLEQRTLELATLNALAEALSSSLQVEDLLDEALSRIVFALGFDGGLISLVDEPTGVLRITGYVGLPVPVVRRLEGHGLEGMPCELVYREQHPLYVEDLDLNAPVDVLGMKELGLRAYAGAPIVHQGRCLGTLSLFDREPHAVSETEGHLLVAVGQQIGVAVENARLFESTQQRVQELSLLHDVALAAVSEVNVQETLHRAAEALSAAMGGAFVALALLDESGQELHIRASAGQPLDHAEHLVLQVGEGITGWVAQSAEPALVPDVRVDPRYVDGWSDTRSELCVPLAAEGRVIGVLNVESPRANGFTLDDQRLLSILASNLVSLIERARLFEEVSAARLELEARAGELSEANRRLQELDRMKSEFLANMSHELRTPLNAILGFAQLLDRSRTLSSEHRKSLQVISDSGEHLLSMINDILDMSRIEAGRVTLSPTDFDLYQMLDSIEAMMRVRAEVKGLQLIVVRGADVPGYVRSDERKLRQILINLLSNAIKFTQEGDIVLRVENAGASDGSAEGVHTLHLEVADSGVGIAPDEIDALFEPFTQTRSGRQAQQGTGLGLPISLKFVQMMGGDLTVRSEVGKGSTFMFDVQLETADRAAVAAGQPARRVVGLAPGQPRYRVLIVDDRAENRLLVCHLLGEVGFDVEEAANGQEAVTRHEAWQPHLIFMDMRMPVMDGYEATQQIKGTAQGQATVIVALTASAFDEDRTLTLSAGCDDYVRKPFREADLFAVLAKYLGVRYVYDSDGDIPEQKVDRAPEKAQLSAAIALLPSDWVADLCDAASRARADLILELASRVEHEHAAVAQALVHLAGDFRFDSILSLAKAQEGVEL
ncbi:MAG TPA: PAS domain S-box protein [Anaerolineae bacterium]|nr:PAS domain S-box protein [Anaerolineae bacterium]